MSIYRHGKSHGLPAGGNGRGLAPRRTNQWEVIGDMLRKADEAKARATAIAEASGSVTPDQIIELKASLRENPDLAVGVCALLGAREASDEVSRNPGGIDLAVAAQRGITLHIGLQKVLERGGYHWSPELPEGSAESFYEAAQTLINTEVVNG